MESKFKSKCGGNHPGMCGKDLYKVSLVALRSFIPPEYDTEEKQRAFLAEFAAPRTVEERVQFEREHNIAETQYMYLLMLYALGVAAAHGLEFHGITEAEGMLKLMTSYQAKHEEEQRAEFLDALEHLNEGQRDFGRPLWKKDPPLVN